MAHSEGSLAAALVLGPCICLLFCPLLVMGADSDEVTLFREDFDTKDPYWFWWVSGTGSGTVRDGYAFLNITDESVMESSSRAGISPVDYDRIPTKPTPLPDAERWLYVSVETRLRWSDDNKLESDAGGGLRAWGLAEEFVWPLNKLMFISWSPEAGPESAGFEIASNVNDSSTLREPITGIDMTEWHTYTITWEEGNAAFLVDGEVVGTTDTTPTASMNFDIYLENLLPEGRMDMEHNVSVQVDYIRLFTSEGRYRDWSEEISGLFSTAEEMIDEAEKNCMNTTNLKKDYYENAKDVWREGYYNYFGAKAYLEEIIALAGLWDELFEMFTTCAARIEQARQDGAADRTIMMMEGYYTQAESKWKAYDHVYAQMYLEKILAMPEPTVALVLGLIFLPALLRRR